MDGIKDKRPTFLMAKEICDFHKASYAIEQFGFSKGDWAAIRDVCCENGYLLPEPGLLQIEFYPIGWTPDMYMEIVHE